MKRQIRRILFETNSSSVHSLTICDKDTYEKWKKGKILYDGWNETFVTEEDVRKSNPELSRDDYIIEGIVTRDEFDEKYGYNFETYKTEYTTPNGETIIAFGYYGYDE